VKHGEGSTNSSEFSLLKFLLLGYHHSYFLATTLYFTSFFTTAYLGAAHFLYSWAVFGLDIDLLLSIIYYFKHTAVFLQRVHLGRGSIITYELFKNVTRPVKTGQVSTNFTLSHTRSFLSTRREFYGLIRVVVKFMAMINQQNKL